MALSKIINSNITQFFVILLLWQLLKSTFRTQLVVEIINNGIDGGRAKA